MEKEEPTNHKILDTDTITECGICLDDFDDIKCGIVVCGCGNKVCVNCVKQCLLHSTKEPHCENCKRGWDRSFQYENMGSKWINGAYKKHRKAILLEKEKARMPETQQFVELYMNKEDLLEQADALQEEADQLHALSLQKLRDKELKLAQYKNVKKHVYTNIELKPAEKKKFIKKCPNDGCRGFLSISYKCDLCKVNVCSKCHEIKGKEEHVCDEDVIKSVKHLKKTTKPCPSCATPIFKIDGCDQMWCTQCNVAFSWKTGKLETGVVHNPHYYKWMEKQNKGIQNPGAVVCGGIPYMYNAFKKIRSLEYSFTRELDKRFINNNFYKMFGMSESDLYNDLLCHLHHAATHNRHVTIDTLRNKLNGGYDNRDLRVRYMCNEIDEKHLAKMIMQRDNVREKELAILHIYELFNTVMIESLNEMNNIIKQMSDNVYHKDKFDALDKVIHYILKTRNYCNNELKKVSKDYNMKVNLYDLSCIIKDKMEKFT